MYVGVVVNEYDPDKQGKLACEILDESDRDPSLDSKPIEVYYVSPWNPKQGGGLGAIPQVGDVILIGTAHNSDDYFYMGTVVGYDHYGAVSPNNLGANDKMYSKGFTTNSFGFTNKRNAGFVVTDEADENDVERNVVMQGSAGHRVQLNDTPYFDKILLVNDDNSSKIEVTNKTYDSGKIAGDSINVEAGKNVHIKAKAAIDMMVDSQGGPLSIQNYSSPITATFAGAIQGAAAGIGGVLATAITGLVDLSPGEITVRSLKNRVNIRSGFPPSPSAPQEVDFLGVFIQTGGLPAVSWAPALATTVPTVPGGVIQLRSDGKVEILAAKGIDLITLAGDINIKSLAGNVNIKGLTTNLNPPEILSVMTATLNNNEIEGNYLGVE